MPPKFKIGDIVRYSDGCSALFRVTLVKDNHGGAGSHRYYGVHFLGGIEGRYESQLTLANEEDISYWKEEHGSTRLPLNRNIICLCGSTKFKKEFEEIEAKLTLEGNIVLTVGCFVHADKTPITEEDKFVLDKLHLDKINMAHEIFVIDVGGYIGDSTKREINHAKECGHPIRYYSEEIK